MKILIGYDGSDNADRALARAIELSKDDGAEIVIVLHVDLEALETFAARRLLGELRDEMVKKAESVANHAAVRAREAGIKNVRSLVLEGGGPSDAILLTAEREKADLVVVGRRGVRGVTRFLLGSVSSRVVDHAGCDVLVVR